MDRQMYGNSVITMGTAPPPIRITVENVIDGHHAEDFYGLYLTAFGPLQTRAVARQVLHQDEFMAEMIDQRVRKYVAWDAEGAPIAMATLTRSLETVPWISPEYFAARYPEHASRNAIYYLGFILVHPSYRRSRVMEQIVDAIAVPLEKEKAICGFDVCAFNNATFDFARHIESMLHRLTRGEMSLIDDQLYYAMSFT
jgi:hypothetical protein